MKYSENTQNLKILFKITVATIILPNLSNDELQEI